MESIDTLTFAVSLASILIGAYAIFVSWKYNSLKKQNENALLDSKIDEIYDTMDRLYDRNNSRIRDISTRVNNALNTMEKDLQDQMDDMRNELNVSVNDIERHIDGLDEQIGDVRKSIFDEISFLESKMNEDRYPAPWDSEDLTDDCEFEKKAVEL